MISRTVHVSEKLTTGAATCAVVCKSSFPHKTTPCNWSSLSISFLFSKPNKNVFCFKENLKQWHKMAGFVKPKKVSRVSPFFSPTNRRAALFCLCCLLRRAISGVRVEGSGVWVGWALSFFLGSLDNEMMCDFHMFSLFWSSKVWWYSCKLILGEVDHYCIVAASFEDVSSWTCSKKMTWKFRSS